MINSSLAPRPVRPNCGNTDCAVPDLKFMQEKKSRLPHKGRIGTWPVLRTYRADGVARVAMPVGGIGTGTVSFCGSGAWRHWETANRPAKGFTPYGQATGPFFALFAKKKGAKPVTRLLESPLPVADWEGAEGSPAINAGVPRFRTGVFHAAYPLARLELTDAAMPLRAAVEVFNPLIPSDTERSGLPVALVRVRLRNPSREAVAASVCGVLPNFIGNDGFELKADEFRGRLNPTGSIRNRNTWKDADGLRGLALSSDGVARDHPAWGTLALATTARTGVTHRTGWADAGWADALFDFWADFSADGKLEPRTTQSDTPVASLAVSLTVPAGAERTVEFVLAWHFPNREAWGASSGKKPAIIGNYYTTQFPDAWAAAASAARRWPELERATVGFVRSLTESDVPAAVKEAALFNLSTLRSQTCFRTPDGHFFGWEGCFDRKGSCHGSCTHVWNYEHATANLFPSLARSMREIEFSAAAMNDEGFMGFRIQLPLGARPLYGTAAADGQMGCLLKLHREWRLSGDTAWLKTLWPHARKALEFCWLPGGWDADQDGVMEGAQHNTMDVEYYGPNPQMASWYLGALLAAEAMASALGEVDFAGKCRDLAMRGRAWVDRNLFNGQYYVHQIRPPGDWAKVRPGLVAGMGAKDAGQPDYQLGAGCLVDQLAGQVNAHFENLGHVLDARHEKKALRAVLKHNRRAGFAGHFNPMRCYVLGDETALLMASYPLGHRPTRPFPYYTEVMTGFEYCVAVHLVQEGLVREGLKVVRDIRARYDGRKRNPFDEAECGHHYARALAAWGLIPALTGFHYSGLTKALTFAAVRQPRRWPWAAGVAWGTAELRPLAGKGTALALTVLGGALPLRRLSLGPGRAIDLSRTRTLTPGRTYKFTLPPR